MAKRGQFYPYRVAFDYPNAGHGVIPLMTVEDVNREGMALLRRGASIEVHHVDRESRQRKLLTSATPADLPPEEDEDE